jgi:hypothetical protein
MKFGRQNLNEPQWSHRDREPEVEVQVVDLAGVVKVGYLREGSCAKKKHHKILHTPP